MITEGVLVDSSSVTWMGGSVSMEMKRVNGDDQLKKIAGQLRKISPAEINRLNDIFPDSVFIIHEQNAMRHHRFLTALLDGHDFPTRACMIILEGDGDPSVCGQIKRDLGVNPEVVSTLKELRTALKSHLNTMDPEAKNGIKNLCEFEREVNKLLDQKIEIVPDVYRGQCE